MQHIYSFYTFKCQMRVQMLFLRISQLDKNKSLLGTLNTCIYADIWPFPCRNIHLQPQRKHISFSIASRNPQTASATFKRGKHWNCEFLAEGSIRCTLFKYLFPFVEANPLPYFLQAVNIDCHRGWERGGSISITAFHYMADDSRAECASSMQPRI